MAETYAGIILIGSVFLLVLAICWIILPFALIGTKPLLRELLARQERTNVLLQQLVDRTPPANANRILDR